jgi:hypothetical protein
VEYTGRIKNILEETIQSGLSSRQFRTRLAEQQLEGGSKLGDVVQGDNVWLGE